MEKNKWTIENIKKSDIKIIAILLLQTLLCLYLFFYGLFSNTDTILMLEALLLLALIIPLLITKVKDLEDSFTIKRIKDDMEQLKKESKENISKSNNIPMNWEGQNNVLTDMFRQAKNKGYLTNSIPDIALFLKENFSCFEKTKLSTIETQLKNNTSSANSIPKEEKRIRLEK